MKTLHLTVNKYWFDMIKSGVKKEEYREIKKYWINRLCMIKEPRFLWYFNKYDTVTFKNGYAKDAPSVCVEFKGIRIGKPKTEWCADAIDFDEDNGDYEDCFIIELGNIIEE